MKQNLVTRVALMIGLTIVVVIMLAFARWRYDQLPTQAVAIETLLATAPQCQDQWHLEERYTVVVPGPYELPLSQSWVVCEVTGAEILIRHR